MKQFSLAVVALAVHVLCITYVSASSANNHSSKLKRLRNKPKSVQQNRSVLEEVFDPYLGLVEDLDGRKELVVDAQISMVLVEPMPSSRPTSLEPTLSPSSVPSHSPTSIDFGKVEGKARNSAVGAELAMSAFAVLLITGFPS